MEKNSLELKIKDTVLIIRQMIEEYVKENAKYSVGDVVTSSLSKDGVFVITKIGYEMSHGIIYYGKKIRKIDGVISYQDMDCSVGTPENRINKTTLVLKDGISISHIDDNIYFDKDIIIKLNI
jgi:hypothetical protein